MKTLSEERRNRAVTLIRTQARPLERFLYAYYFEEGAAEDVHAALSAFQNPDGGLGHALEPDARAPDSMALHVEFGFRNLRLAGARDPGLARDACDFLASIAEPTALICVAPSRVTAGTGRLLQPPDQGKQIIDHRRQQAPPLVVARKCGITPHTGWRKARMMRIAAAEGAD